MKILFITSLLGAEYGGAEVSTSLLLESLIAHGHKVQALTTRKHPKDPSLISISLLIEVPKKLLTLGNSQIDYFLAKKIRRQLELIKPDVIHIQDTYILPATIAANKSLKIPSVVTIRNSVLDETWHLMFPRPISTMLSWRNKIIIKNIQQTDSVISVSEYIKTELIQRGIKSQKIFAIYNLPPLIKCCPTSGFNKSDSTVHLLAPGFLASFKGFSVLIKALEDIVKNNRNVDLTIVGDGPKRTELEKLAQRLLLTSYVTFTGKIPFSSLIQYYTQSDIVIFPSIYAEPLGRVSLEAMYFCKPIVASRVGGIPEVVENKKTGLLVAQDNPKELARAVLTLVNNPQLRKLMGENGKSVLNTKFQESTILAQHLQAYTYAMKKN